MGKGEEEFLLDKKEKHQEEYCSRNPLFETNIRHNSPFTGPIIATRLRIGKP
jgi:hypothetical protein